MEHRVGKEILRAYPFDDEKTTVLDFACGTGMVIVWSVGRPVDTF